MEILRTRPVWNYNFNSEHKIVSTVIGILFFVSTSSANTFLDPTVPIHFPLRNIHNSIDLSYNSSYKYNYTYEYNYHQTNDGYTLNLPSLGLQHPPNPYPGFIESREVTCLNLRENGIFRIQPGSFESVPNLKYLDLSRNNLAFCDFFNYGSCMESLQTLIIEENHLPGDSLNHEISTAGCFPRVEQLYLRKDRIRKINFSLRESFPSLVSLFLSDNQIDTCLFVQDVPETLTHLYVERNQISSISTTHIMRNIKTLSADSNIIRSVCLKSCDASSIKLLGASKLEVLSLAYNKITRLESCAFRDSYRLRCLNLAGNSIETIHESTFSAAQSLSQLNLDNNLLSCIPNLSNNHHLSSLSLRNNRITYIRREQFSSMSTLQTLLLGGNRISQIQCDTFASLTWLQKLDLSDNGLTSLPQGWMNGLMNLKHLDLRKNHFTCIRDFSFSSSLSLTSIYLQNTGLRERDVSAIQSYFPFAKIHLY